MVSSLSNKLLWDIHGTTLPAFSIYRAIVMQSIFSQIITINSLYLSLVGLLIHSSIWVEHCRKRGARSFFELWIIYLSHIDGLMQTRRNSSALAMELRLSCTNPPTCWVSVGLYSDWFCTSVTSVPYAIPCTIGPCCNGTPLWQELLPVI